MAPKKKTEPPKGVTLDCVWKKYCSRFAKDILPLLPYHQHALDNIVNSWDASIPNLLIYGVAGMPLFPIWNYLILQPMKRDFGSLSFQHLKFVQGSAELPYTETDAYIHIDMSNPDVPRDSDILFEFLKAILPSRCMHLHKHIVVLENIDMLASKSQVMRVLLERYSNNVWFVATTNRVGAIEPPIMSRFMAVRIPLPSHNEVIAIADALHLTLSHPVSRNLTETLRSALRASTPPTEKKGFVLPQTLTSVRNEAQHMLQIDAPLSHLCFNILSQCPEKKRAALLDRLADIEAAYHVRRKGRDIIYYEALLLSLL